MYINLKRSEQGVLQAHIEDTENSRDKLFDWVMSLSDFAHEKGLSDVSVHLEEVLDTILETPKPPARIVPKHATSKRAKRQVPG